MFQTKIALWCPNKANVSAFVQITDVTVRLIMVFKSINTEYCEFLFCFSVTWPPFLNMDRPENFGLNYTRSFKIRTSDDVTLGAWWVGVSTLHASRIPVPATIPDVILYVLHALDHECTTLSSPNVSLLGTYCQRIWKLNRDLLTTDSHIYWRAVIRWWSISMATLAPG